jgi:hypothetical protein
VQTNSMLYDSTWKKTVSGAPLRSRHLYLAAIFNLLAYSNLVALAIRFRGDVRFQPNRPTASGDSTAGRIARCLRPTLRSQFA